MELTYDEKLKLENTKEHLQVVLANLRIVNTEYNLVLDKITEAENQLAETNEKQAELNRYNSLATELLNERETDLNSTKASLDARENNINTLSEECIKKMDSLKETTKDTLSQFTGDIEKLSEDKDKLTKEVTHLESIVGYLKAKVKENEDIKTKELEDIQKLKDEKSRLTAEVEGAESNLREFREKSEREREDINKQIESEREKISLPMALLTESKEELVRKERNLQVLTNRLRKQFMKQNPDRGLPTELQNESES